MARLITCLDKETRRSLAVVLGYRKIQVSWPLNEHVWPCVISAVVDDEFIRGQFMTDADGSMIWLDLPIDLFNRLPQYEVAS